MLLLAAGTLSLQAILLDLGHYGGHDYYFNRRPHTSQDARSVRGSR